MKLGWSLLKEKNRTWSLSSWKSRDDPSPGPLTYSVDPSGSGLPQAFLRNGSEIMFRSETFGEHPEQVNNRFYETIYIFNTNEVYYTFVDIKPHISRFILNRSGFLNHLISSDTRPRRDWVSRITFNEDNCDKYAICGAYGTCNIHGAPICKCPEGFSLKSQEIWNTFDPNAGCVRRFPLNCKKGVWFQKLTGVKLPDKSQLLNNNNSLPCETECLNRCSCTAYAETNVSRCVLWFGDLVDIREYIEGGSDLYIRMDPAEKDLRVIKIKIIVISVVLGTFLLGSSIICLAWFMIWKKRRANKEGK